MINYFYILLKVSLPHTCTKTSLQQGNEANIAQARNPSTICIILRIPSALYKGFFIFEPFQVYESCINNFKIITRSLPYALSHPYTTVPPLVLIVRFLKESLFISTKYIISSEGEFFNSGPWSSMFAKTISKSASSSILYLYVFDPKIENTS